MNDLITIEEIQQFRTPNEFIEWFDFFLEKTKVDETFKKNILLGKGIFKDVYEEVLPVFNFLRIFGGEWPDLRIRNLLSDQNYDVETEVDDSGPFNYIEITTADMDHQEHLRMKYFYDHGVVCPIGNVTSTGTNRTGQKIEVETEAIETKGILKKKLGNIINSIEKKIEKIYPKDTALLVSFNDRIGFTDDENCEAVSSAISSLDSKWESVFISIYVIGDSGKRAWRKNKGEPIGRYNYD